MASTVKNYIRRCFVILVGSAFAVPLLAGLIWFFTSAPPTPDDPDAGHAIEVRCEQELQAVKNARDAYESAATELQTAHSRQTRRKAAAAEQDFAAATKKAAEECPLAQ